MKVWDVFTFWREQWALEARRGLWAGVEGYEPLALVGDRTHRGKLHSLPLWTPPWGVESVVVVLDADSDWGREAQQRDAIGTPLPRMHPNDLILLCDADEFVDPAALPAIVEATERGPVKLKMQHYMCGTRWRNRNAWRHAAACRVRDLPEHPTADLRMNFGLPRVADAGWHLTYFGSPADWDAKLSAFAHAEYDTAQTREDLAQFRGGPDWLDEPLTGPLADILAGVAA